MKLFRYLLFLLFLNSSVVNSMDIYLCSKIYKHREKIFSGLVAGFVAYQAYKKLKPYLTWPIANMLYGFAFHNQANGIQRYLDGNRVQSQQAARQELVKTPLNNNNALTLALDFIQNEQPVQKEILEFEEAYRLDNVEAARKIAATVEGYLDLFLRNDQDYLNLFNALGGDNILNLFAALNIDINSTDRLMGWTILMWAAATGNEQLVQQVSTHPDIDSTLRDQKGRTALDIARLFGRDSIVKYLSQYIG